MIKKHIIIFFLVISSFLLGNQFKEVESFNAKTTETTLKNNKTTVTKYKLKLKFPDMVYKEITYPEMNRGEVYLYVENEKKIYYPLLEQIITQEIDENENQILGVLRDLKESEKTEEIKFLEYENGTKILFNNYKKINGINFPTTVKIYEENNLISKLEFSDIKINSKLNKKDFQIDIKE
ncbi:MAG: LolA family protein [Fusobacteriota bacterium]